MYPLITALNAQRRVYSQKAVDVNDIYNSDMDIIQYANEESYNEDYLY